MTDIDLTTRAAAGDEAAFADLYERYNRRLLQFVRSKVRNPQDAEDIASRTWMQAWRHIGAYRGDSQFSTWLRRIAINEWRMAWRAQGSAVRGAHAAHVSIDDPESVTARRVAAPQQIDRQAIARADAERALAMLAPCMQRVLVAYYIDGLTIVDIARQLGIAEGTVKGYMHRARKSARRIKFLLAAQAA